MIKRLVIFGATGDLTARYLLPGIAALHDAGLLPERFALTWSGRVPRGGVRAARRAAAARQPHRT